MDYLDLNNWTDDQQKRLLHFTEDLAEREQFANFGNPDDVSQAETSAKDYIHRRKAKIRQIDDKEDAEIRKGVREWLKRTGRLARYSR